MSRFTKAALALVALTMVATAAHAAGDPTGSFVEDLYSRFAFRAPTSAERDYWAVQVHARTPEAAETHLRNFFFVHAAYKTMVDRSVTIHDVTDMVAMLDSGQLTFQAVQWSLSQSDEYKAAKAAGRVGKPMDPRFAQPL